MSDNNDTIEKSVIDEVITELQLQDYSHNMLFKSNNLDYHRGLSDAYQRCALVLQAVLKKENYRYLFTFENHG